MTDDLGLGYYGGVIFGLAGGMGLVAAESPTKCRFVNFFEMLVSHLNRFAQTLACHETVEMFSKIDNSTYVRQTGTL